jgi:hypothetical protein
MSKIEVLQPNWAVPGIPPDCLVTVVGVQRCRTMAVTCGWHEFEEGAPVSSIEVNP